MSSNADSTTAGGSAAPPPGALLLLIDIQAGFDEAQEEWWGGQRNNPGAERATAALLRKWRSEGWPVAHVRHSSIHAASPLREDKPGFEFKPEAMPAEGEPVYVKHVNSGFIGTRLEQDLRSQGCDAVVIAGFTTNHCVSTTARMAANLGFKVWLVQDACVSYDRTGPDGRRWDAQTLHETALASLHGEFATVITLEQAGARA